MAWRVAESLDQLRDQIDKAWPNRNKASDGTIGDAAHATSDSDHNPWVKDGGMGVVTALDITHDPAHGCDCNKITAALIASRDPRIKYLIWNRRIWRSYKHHAGHPPPWTPEAYTGSNPHDHHSHLSVQPTKALYDSRKEWRIRAKPPPPQWSVTFTDKAGKRHTQVTRFPKVWVLRHPGSFGRGAVIFRKKLA
jgi:hypothetical protein